MKHEQDPIRITTAAAPRSENLRTRQRRYLFAMTTRSVCFVSGVMAALAGLSFWPFLMAGAIVLPYFAVVAANVGAQPQTAPLLNPVTPRELEPRG